MKKIIKLTIFALILSLLLGCSKKMPEITPTKMTEDLIQTTITTTSRMLKQMFENVDDETTKKIADSMINVVAESTFTTSNEVIDGDTASVDVTISAYDLGSVFANFLDGAMAKAMEIAQERKAITEDEITQLLLDYFNEMVEETKNNGKSFQTEITINYNLDESGNTWVPILNDELNQQISNALTGNLITTLAELGY